MIPQITAVFGTCGGGMAVVPALTDFTFIEAEKGKIFVNCPNALDGKQSQINVIQQQLRSRVKKQDLSTAVGSRRRDSGTDP